MFDNISEKIKTLAKVICWVGIIFSIYLAIFSFSKYAEYAEKAEEYKYAEEEYEEKSDEYIAQGFTQMIVGPLLSWASCFVLYGFGQLVENSDKLREELCKKKNNTQAPAFMPISDDQKINELNDLYKEGVISEEAYKQNLAALQNKN